MERTVVSQLDRYLVCATGAVDTSDGTMYPQPDKVTIVI
jgi:hypothetical protein